MRAVYKSFGVAKAGQCIIQQLRQVGARMIEFEIKRDSNRGYLVIRVEGNYNQHAHCSTLNGCRMLINLINSGRLPTSKYLQISCSRLLNEDEYKRLRQKRQRYVNVNKGVR
jgi:hypothetical protein